MTQRIPQEHISECIIEQIINVPFTRSQEHFVDAVKGIPS